MSPSSIAALTVALTTLAFAPVFALDAPTSLLKAASEARRNVSAETVASDLRRIETGYRTYVIGEVEALVRETTKLIAEIRAGKLAEAQRLYPRTRIHFQRIEPVVVTFQDLIKSLDVRASEFELRERDPAFVGFHRLEKGLFYDRTTIDLLQPAERLQYDVLELRERINDLDMPVVKIVANAPALIEEIAGTKLSGEAEPYSRTDLWDLKGNLDGSRAIFDLAFPILRQRDPVFAARVDQTYARVDAVLARYRTSEGGYVSYDQLIARDRNALKGPITVLAEDLATLRGRLGLD